MVLERLVDYALIVFAVECPFVARLLAALLMDSSYTAHNVLPCQHETVRLVTNHLRAILQCCDVLGLSRVVAAVAVDCLTCHR